MIGQLQIEVNGRPAGIQNAEKSEALVAYLALYEGSILWCELQTAFWGNFQTKCLPHPARHFDGYLQNTGRRCRSVIGIPCPLTKTPSAILMLANLLRFSPTRVTAPTPDLLASLELYRGDPLMV